MILDRTLDFITIIAWAAFAIFLLFYMARHAKREGLTKALHPLLSLRFIVFVIIPLLVVTLLSTALVFIQPQEVGVVVSLLSPTGYRDRPLRSGLHMIVPLAEEVTKYPIAWQTYTMSSNPTEGTRKSDDSITARTSDGQEVSLDCSVIYHIEPDQAVRVHIAWQKRYLEDFVRPITRGVMRTLVSQYKVDEINSSKRLDIENDLYNNIQGIFEENGFSLDFFVLRNISFSDEYAAAVEAKQVALQGKISKEYEAEQMRKLAQGSADSVRIQAQAEAEAIRLKAQAEADSLRLLAEALRLNPDLITLRYVDKLAPGIQVMLVPNDAPYLLPLPTMGPPAPTQAAPLSAPVVETLVTPTPLPTLTPFPSNTPDVTATPTP